MKYILCLGLLGFAIAPSEAAAQDFDEFEDSPKKKKKDSLKDKRQVREIERGLYAKSNVGGAFYILDLKEWLKPGTILGLSVGQDFVDRESVSMAWEVGFFQGVHNGTYFDVQAQMGCIELGTCVQGDTRTYSLFSAVEWSRYPSKRIGIGGRIGGGLMFSPLLMDEEFYIDEVVKTWGGYSSSRHDGTYPMGLGGVGIEYYTKLSHFSVGLDVDAFYAVGFDLGSNASGYFKYTF
jgi:hypothetical protein